MKAGFFSILFPVVFLPEARTVLSARACMPAVLCVLLHPRTWSPLCQSDSLGESQGFWDVD